MEILLCAAGVCFVLLMLLLGSWLMNLEERVRRLEQPRAPLEGADFKVLPPARRRSSGAE